MAVRILGPPPQLKRKHKQSMAAVDSDLNSDPEEVAKFEALASRWWDTEGEFKPLHDINPVRLDYIAQRLDLAHADVIEVGCGGGILTDALAGRGAKVTGIDMAPGPLTVAKLHALESGNTVNYQQITAEEQRDKTPHAFDLVACLEVLEHVPDVGSTVQACADLARPGAPLVFATINRTPQAYALAILGAEYIMNILPRGTHDWERFIKPSELARHCRNAGLEVKDISGMKYNPFTRAAGLTRNTSVNYIMHAQKPNQKPNQKPKKT